MAHTYKGLYEVQNPEKYIGDSKNVVYRSSWELKFSKYLDHNHNVKRWASEEMAIPYYYPLDEKMHRYFPDYYVEFTNKKISVIEIKPFAETMQPILKKGGNKRVFGDRLATYMKNCAKWDAAKAFCLERGWTFHVFTEKSLALLR